MSMLRVGLLTPRSLCLVAASVMLPVIVFATSAVAAPQADLTIESVEGLPPLLYSGDPVKPMKIVVKNIGTAPASPIALTLSCVPIPPTTTACPNTVTLGWGPTSDSLAPGATRAFPQWPSTNPPAWSTGTYRITVSVDANHQVAESNETNNARTLDAIVKNAVFEAYLTPKSYLGKCPVGDLDVVTGTIRAIHGGGLVRWQIIVSWNDPAKPPHVYEATLKPGQSAPVGVKTAVSKSVEGWARVHFVSPEEKDSAQAHFKVNCLAGIAPMKKTPTFSPKK